LREDYRGSINVGFNGMPAIELETLIARENASAIERFSIATKRRRFTLKEDWEIELSEIEYVSELNGTIVLPKDNSDSNPNVFDGASVPVPWLVSLLTIGVLRPLGVMLIGSILHDYAYSHGSLGTVNSLPFVGYIAWLAVRIGWLWVPYNQTFRTGRKPYCEYLFVITLVFILFLAGNLLGFNLLLYVFIGWYFAFYIASLLLQKRYS